MRLVLHMKTLLLIVLIFSGASLGAFADNQVKAEIISSLDAAVPGASAMVGVLFAVPERAHIYWRNPGDSGLATGIDWNLSEDFAVGELQWPAPTQFSVEGLEDERYFGYSGETLLFAEVTIPDDVKQGTEIVIRANAYWLICLDDGICIPEDVDLELSIAVGSGSKPSSSDATFNRYQKEVPSGLANADSPITLEWSMDPKTALTVRTRGASQFSMDTAEHESAFYPYAGGAWTMEFSESSARLSMVVVRPKDKNAKPIGGVLVYSLKGASERATNKHATIKSWTIQHAPRRYAIEVQAPKIP